MSKILKNQTASDVQVTDTGVTVLASSNYTIPPQDYLTFAASSDVIRLLADVTLVLNDGGTDITSLSQAVDIIKGWAPAAPTTSSNTFFFDYTGIVSGATPVTLISYTVPVGLVLSISRLELACRVESTVEIQKNGDVIGVIRTGAASPKDSFHWSPNRSLSEGDLLEIILTKRAGSADISVGAHLMGSTQNS